MLSLSMRRNRWLLPVVLWLAAWPVPAPAQSYGTPSEQRDAEVRDAIGLLAGLGQEQYRGAQGEEAVEIQQRKVDQAIDAIQQAGRGAAPLLREALSEGKPNPAYLIVLASLLVLAEGPSAMEFTTRTLAPVRADAYPDLFFRWLYICLRLKPKGLGPTLDRLFDIPRVAVEIQEFKTKVYAPELVAFAVAAAGPEGRERVLYHLANPGKAGEPFWQNLMTALAHLPSAEYARTLETVIARLKGEKRRAAIWALGKMDDERSVAFLAKLFGGEKDPAARQEIVFALGEMAHPAGLETLAAALKDPRMEVRSTAVASIGSLPLGESGKIITGNMWNEKEPSVRTDYLTALARLKPPGYRNDLERMRRHWPSLTLPIDMLLKQPEGLGPDEPRILPQLAGQVLDLRQWQTLLIEVEESRGLSLPLNQKTIVLTARLEDLAYFEKLLPEVCGTLSLDNFRAFEAYQDIYRLVRRKWRKRPQPTFRGPPTRPLPVQGP